MQALTDLADLAVLLPLSLCVALWLWGGGWGRGAWLWLGGLAAVLVVMLAAKLALLGCARLGTMVSPSGHTAAATYVYGGMVALAARLRLTAAACAGGAAAVLFGLSRIAVHAHSLTEVVAGGAVGLTVLMVTLRVSGAVPPQLRPAPLLLCAGPLILVLHGARLNMEPRVRGTAAWLDICL